MARRVGLAGLGLIGGSLGMSLVQRGNLEVIGYDILPEVTGAALASGAVTAAAAALAALAEAEIIIIATPVSSVLSTIASLSPFLKSGAIVTDTASTKAEITASAAAMVPPGVYFVGGHPMAGSEKAGLAAADPYLFENAVYALTTDPPAPPWVYTELQEVLSCTGAKFIQMSPAEHDTIAAGISHLPHLVAAALVNTAAALSPAHPQTLSLAGGGFRDTTRIAGGNAGLWAEILASNRASVAAVLATFRAELDRLAHALSTGNERDLTNLLNAAKNTRAEIPAKGKGLIGKVEELVVAVQDRPGAIKEVLDVLAAEEINVKDIEIMRLREGEGGTLRLAVEDEKALQRAVEILTSAGLRARKR